MRLASTFLLAAAVVCWVLPHPAAALPTMIRLGYTNCASCHIAPQGAGLLNSYGRGIDEAQSLRAGEYSATETGRMSFDVRSVTQEQLSTLTNKPVTGLLRTRMIFRHATELGYGLRLTVTGTLENESAPRPALKYESSLNPRAMYRSDLVTFRGYLTTALLSWRATKNLEVSVGRDQLPTGVNIADLGTFIRARNRLGYYDTPTQAKLFWWGKRYQIVPYAFGPSGTEAANSREAGGGSMAEFDVLGKGRTVVGINVLHGEARLTHRTLYGPYLRLGFGKWGILAEHDVTDRSYFAGPVQSFRQNATYSQAFWAMREWLVLSVIGERLKVQRPFEEGVAAGRFEVAARLSSNFTVTTGVRVQRNLVNGQQGPAATIQLAMKPVLPTVWRSK
jgi:hypothetical protein